MLSVSDSEPVGITTQRLVSPTRTALVDPSLQADDRCPSRDPAEVAGAHLWPEVLMEITCGRRKSQARSSWMNGATKPPAAASTWMGTSHPFSSFSFTAGHTGAEFGCSSYTLSSFQCLVQIVRVGYIRNYTACTRSELSFMTIT